MRQQVTEKVLLPGKFRMLLQMLGRMEVDSTGVSHCRRKRHVLHQGCIGRLVLNSPRNSIMRLPGLRSTLRQVNVTAQCALAGLGPLPECIVVVAQKTLRSRNIDVPFVLGHHLIPPDVPGIGADAHVLHWKIGLLRNQLGVIGEIGSYKHAVFGALQRHIAQAQFQAADLISDRYSIERSRFGSAGKVAEGSQHDRADAYGRTGRGCGAHVRPEYLGRAGLHFRSG